MSNLISGKEALENYNEAQVRFSSKEDWVDLKVSIFSISDILREKCFKGCWWDLIFRLKPQTITINGIEVPKPDYIVDTPHDYDGCWEINIGGTYYLFKTEQNYKQVVEALRSVLNG